MELKLCPPRLVPAHCVKWGYVNAHGAFIEAVAANEVFPREEVAPPVVDTPGLPVRTEASQGPSPRKPTLRIV